FRPLPFVDWGRSMSEAAASTAVRAPTPTGPPDPGEDLVCAFNEVRTELVSSLFFLLGNYEDALDAAQEAFLKCWRARDSFTEIQNLRAWIFRVGLNAAKDLQRNAWRRRARPLTAAAALEGVESVSPAETAAEREDNERLRQALLDLRPEEKEVFLLRQN